MCFNKHLFNAASLPLLTRTIMLVGSYCKAVQRIVRSPARNMALVIEGSFFDYLKYRAFVHLVRDPFSLILRLFDSNSDVLIVWHGFVYSEDVLPSMCIRGNSHLRFVGIQPPGIRALHLFLSREPLSQPRASSKSRNTDPRVQEAVALGSPIKALGCLLVGCYCTSTFWVFYGLYSIGAKGLFFW